MDAAGTTRYTYTTLARSMRITVVCLGLAAVLLSGTFVFLKVLSHRSEPAYNGVRLRRWLTRLSADDPQAETAIRNIGTNAIPPLLDLISKSDSSVMAHLFQRLPSLQRFVPSTNADHFSGWMGFRSLGQIAEPAIPQLARLVESTNSSRMAALALASVGPLGVEALVRASGNSNPTIRCHIMLALGAARTGTLTAFRAITNSLGEPEYIVRFAAADSLGHLAVNPDASVAALVNATRDTNRAVRYAATSSLGSFQRISDIASNHLATAARDPDSLISSAARNAINTNKYF